MNPEDPQYRSRYDTSGNVEAEYVDAARTVLVNKLGIRDLTALQAEEERGLTDAYEKLLKQTTYSTRLTCDLLRYIHEAIFGDLYAWAGRWRTVWISKPGITWPPPDFLDRAMSDFEAKVLRKYSPGELAGDQKFADALAEVQGEFLVIHPFREGNARTMKLACDLLALQTGRPPLRYDDSDAGRDAYIAGAQAAFKRDYARLSRLIAEAALRGRQAPPNA